MYRMMGADGKEYGPVSADQLRTWMREGRVNAQTYILAEGGREWKMFGSLPEFTRHSGFQAAPPGPIRMDYLPRRTNSMATTGLILGMVALTFGLCCCYGFPFNLLGLIFSLIGYSEIRKAPDIYNGQGIAIAGIVISILSILLAIGLITFIGVVSVLDGAGGHVYKL
ncbi:MAG: DUF4339 domain-containing protein [Akkermansiaceae bacterium]|nr:DUF4339 domain-containing protein [Verrucomicrobiales bacterium]